MMTDRKPVCYIFLFCLIGFTYFIYLQGIGGALYYDDFRPLSGLANVGSVHAKLVYVVGEVSGPLGRPISMISFLINESDWPGNIGNILHFNVFLHCVNAILVFFLCRLLLKLGQPELKGSEWPALIASALWMLSPLLISTSLIAVQRMAGLSAFFLFIGLILYLVCFVFYVEKPKLRLFMQAFFIGLFTVLSMFSKENGVLLPVFALVIEATLLRRNETARKFRAVRVAAFSICFLTVVGYLSSRVLTAEQDYLHRSYTLAERLLTQPVILFDYLRLAFLPDIFSYSPFHDSYPHFTAISQWQVAVAIFTLIVLLVLAVRFRSKYSIFSFAVLWFLAAHLLESTVVSLELYFEHRNYIALVGPCLALAVGASKIHVRYQSLTKFIFSLYLCLLAFSSYQVASIWGDQPVAAKIWFENGKGSARAAEHYAIQLLGRNQPEQAYLVLQKQAENCPECIGSQVQAMQLACRFNEPEKASMYYQRAMQLSGKAKSLGSAPSSLAAIINDVNEGNCTQISFDQLKRLNVSLLPNKKGEGRLAILVNLHQIARAQNDTIANIDYLQQAWGVENNRAIGQLLVGNLIEIKKFDEAQLFIDTEMCAVLPMLLPLRKSELKKCELATRWLVEAVEDSKDTF